METVGEYTRFKNLQNQTNIWLSSLGDWNYYLTFNFNASQANLLTGRKKLKIFAAKIDRIMCGKDFTQLCPYTERNFFIAFPEHLKSNFHYHALLRSPDPELFKAIANDIWEELVPSGDIFFPDKIPSLTAEKSLIQEDVFKIANYITKESYQSLQYGNYIISSEFSPQKINFTVN